MTSIKGSDVLGVSSGQPGVRALGELTQKGAGNEDKEQSAARSSHHEACDHRSEILKMDLPSVRSGSAVPGRPLGLPEQGAEPAMWPELRPCQCSPAPAAPAHQSPFSWTGASRMSHDSSERDIKMNALLGVLDCLAAVRDLKQSSWTGCPGWDGCTAGKHQPARHMSRSWPTAQP